MIKFGALIRSLVPIGGFAAIFMHRHAAMNIYPRSSSTRARSLAASRGRPHRARLTVTVVLSLLGRLFEIPQIRWRMVFANWHQQPISAHEIAFPPDSDQRAVHVFDTAILGPARTRIGIVHIFFVHGPRPCQRMIDRGDLVVKDVRIGLVAEDALLEGGLVVERKRQAGRVVSPGALAGSGRR